MLAAEEFLLMLAVAHEHSPASRTGIALARSVRPHAYGWGLLRGAHAPTCAPANAPIEVKNPIPSTEGPYPSSTAFWAAGRIPTTVPVPFVIPAMPRAEPARLRPAQRSTTRSLVSNRSSVAASATYCPAQALTGRVSGSSAPM